MSSKNNNRLGRIDEELKKEISNIINYELKNPNITGLISVTKNTKDTLANLKKSAGFIRTEIAKRINLRITPELVFVLDDSMEYGERIDRILKKIIPNDKPEE